tara:strand:+ start:3975 stop:4244 length:270 start_codon:yes stop_codon:yes gene_type:complete
LKIYETNCDPTLAEDKLLPNNAFLVKYSDKEEIKYDIVICSKKVSIFDHYYDQYKKGLLDITQTAGTVNPKLWNDPKQPQSQPKSSKKK